MFPISTQLRGADAIARDRDRARTVLVVTALSLLWATLFAGALL